MGLSRGLPFWPSQAGEYSPFTFGVPRFKRTFTSAPPPDDFCAERRYFTPMFFAVAKSLRDFAARRT